MVARRSCARESLQRTAKDSVVQNKLRKVDLQRFDGNMESMAYFVLLVCLVAGGFAEDPEINMNVVCEYMRPYFEIISYDPR